MFLFHVLYPLQHSFLTLQAFLLASQLVESSPQLRILTAELGQLITRLTVTSFAISCRLHTLQLFMKAVPALAFHTNQCHQSSEFLLLSGQTFPQSALIIFIGFQQRLLQSAQTGEQILPIAFKLAIQLFIILLQIASLISYISLRLVSSGHCLLQGAIGLLSALEQRLVLVACVFGGDFELLLADQQMLVLEVLLADLVLSDDGGQRTGGRGRLGLELAVYGGEGHQDGEGIGAAVHILYGSNHQGRARSWRQQGVRLCIVVGD